MQHSPVTSRLVIELPQVLPQRLFCRATCLRLHGIKGKIKKERWKALQSVCWAQEKESQIRACPGCPANLHLQFPFHVHHLLIQHDHAKSPCSVCAQTTTNTTCFPWVSWVTVSNILTGTLWLFNIAMEHGPFIDGVPIKNGDFPWLCQITSWYILQPPSGYRPHCLLEILQLDTATLQVLLMQSSVLSQKGLRPKSDPDDHSTATTCWKMLKVLTGCP